MTDDGKIQEMINKGVSKDILTHPLRFEVCGYCQEVYNEKNQPKLLNCGHFLCAVCFNEAKRCFYPNCNNTNATTKAYNENGSGEVTENSIFGFRLRCNENSIEIRKEVKGSTKIEQLIQEPQIQAYISLYSEVTIIVVLGKKSLSLSDIKHKKIIDLTKECKLVSKYNVYNPLIVKERYLGGINK